MKGGWCSSSTLVSVSTVHTYIYYHVSQKMKHMSGSDILGQLKNIICIAYFPVGLGTPCSVSTPRPPLSVHSALALRSPASLTLGNLSAVLFPLTGGTTTSFPALALCSTRWANTHITQMHARERAHTHAHTTLPLHDNFLSILLSHTFCPQAWRVTGERDSAVILIQQGPIFVKHPGLQLTLSPDSEWVAECTLTRSTQMVSLKLCYVVLYVNTLKKMS